MRGALLVALSVVWYHLFSFTLGSSFSCCVVFRRYVTLVQLNAGAIASSCLVCLCGSGSIPEFSARAGAPRYLSSNCYSPPLLLCKFCIQYINDGYEYSQH